MATRTALRTISRAAAAAIALCVLSASAPASERPRTVGFTTANAAPAQAHRSSVLEQARVESSMLGDIVEEFAARDLGEGHAVEGLDDRTREIAAAAVFAALGDIDAARRHAQQALRYGATDGELREVLYLTAVHAGAPKAIAATRALEELLAE